jgi:hypothetical protein
MSKGYNGWSNWETWNCNLWYENLDEQAQDVFDYIVKEHQSSNVDDFTEECKVKFVNHFASFIEEMVECDKRELLGNDIGFIRDLVNASIRMIDFKEIASKYWDIVNKDEIESIFADAE